MSKENNITIGPSTGKLIWALRSIEKARNDYYIAKAGEDEDYKMDPEQNDVFDKCGEMVEKEICERIRLWAISTDPGVVV